MKYDWIVLAGGGMIAKGTVKASSPARVARKVRKHGKIHPTQTGGAQLMFRPVDWRGKPLSDWSERPLRAGG